MALSLTVPTSAPMTTETTVDGSKMYSYTTQQPYHLPTSPLKHSVCPRPSTSLGLPAAQANVASADVVAIAELLVSIKGTLDQATKTFDLLAGDINVVNDVSPKHLTYSTHLNYMIYSRYAV